MKIRAQRSGYKESMATTQEIEPTTEAVRAYVRVLHPDLPEDCQISVWEYVKDPRNGWDTYLVVADGCACAFTDGPVEEQ